MKQVSYFDRWGGYSYFSIDHKDELEEWEERLGDVRAWNDDDVEAFLYEVTGLTENELEWWHFDRRFLMMYYKEKED